MFETMSNEKARTADRLEAAKWLADRGFGKATDVEAPAGLDVSKVSDADLDLLIGICERMSLSAAEMIESGELRIMPPAETGAGIRA